MADINAEQTIWAPIAELKCGYYCRLIIVFDTYGIFNGAI